MKKKAVKTTSLLAGIFCLIFAAFGAGIAKSATDKTFEVFEKFWGILELVEQRYVDETDIEKLLTGAINGMLQGLDPHSSLIPPAESSAFTEEIQGQFTGIGIEVTSRENKVTVIATMDDSPAHKAGIVTRDIIIKVNDKPIKTVEDAVKAIRGPKGTEVKITIAREGAEKPLEFQIIRDVIPLLSVKAVKFGEYSYVRISQFNDNTNELLENALAKLENDSPLKGLVLDLRDNPGGLLDQALEICDLFLEQGEIVSIKSRFSNSAYYATPGAQKYPLVILINGGSASASEIVAGALQDHRRALLIGTTSFGKGSVQSVIKLKDGSILKLTMARYYTPKGRSIQARGIEPDIFLPFQPKSAPEKNDVRLKESDLEGHLKSESEINSRELEKFENIAGNLNKEKFLKDNQIAYALDLLKGYNILNTR